MNLELSLNELILKKNEITLRHCFLAVKYKHLLLPQRVNSFEYWVKECILG
jgi:hypothetical protein